MGRGDRAGRHHARRRRHRHRHPALGRGHLPREGGSATRPCSSARPPWSATSTPVPGHADPRRPGPGGRRLALVTPALTGGPPIIIDAPSTGVVMDYLVQDGDDKSILSCLKRSWAWTAAPSGPSTSSGTPPQRLPVPLRVRPAIGVQGATAVTFDFPAASPDVLAHRVLRGGQGRHRRHRPRRGRGLSRLTSSPHEATALLAAGWPRWEYRYTPATGVTDPDQLNATPRSPDA
jgi:hypothetical protein